MNLKTSISSGEEFFRRVNLTDEMLEKARNNAKQFEFRNVEFKKGDIERGIPIDDNTSDVVIVRISNYVVIVFQKFLQIRT
jgi:ubiquinone/menaquinone biosynthesis C-methylase UbiE